MAASEVFVILDDEEEQWRFGDDVEIYRVDLKGYVDYETAYDLINKALASRSLDGPDQMRFIQAVADTFLRTE